MIPSYYSPALTPFLSGALNHLWQSTLFLGLAGLLILVLKNHRAQTRYWLWLAASAKFALPFAALVGLGGSLGWIRPGPPPFHVNLPMVMDQVSRPFSPPAVPVTFMSRRPRVAASPVPLLLAIWGCGVAIVGLNWWLRARRVRVALRSATALPIDVGIPVWSSAALLEPGVFGILRPVLLLPHGIEERLTAAQLAAIVQHERCHVRRRDNLAAAFHMCVEAVFWFHPLVWWLGRRLMEERERACDQEVLRMGSQPEEYAQGILNVCKLYVESPLECMAGVTGANLKQRIEDIMTLPHLRELNFARKALLACAGIAAVAGPIGIGLWNAPRGFAQTNTSQYTFGMQTSADKRFEVASIKPGPPGEDGWQLHPPEHGGIVMDNMELHKIIASSFRIQDSMVIGPSWIDSVRYNIVAKGADPTAQNPAVWDMMRFLLAERFQLKYHVEPRERPIYALVVAKGGHKLKRPQDGVCAEAIRRNEHCANLRFSPFNVGITNMPVQAIIGGLGRIMQDRPIVDKTGLTGDYDVEVTWEPEALKPPPPGSELPAPRLDVAAMLTALQDQAGLKLEAQRGPVDFLVIDRIVKPDSN